MRNYGAGYKQTKETWPTLYFIFLKITSLLVSVMENFIFIPFNPFSQPLFYIQENYKSKTKTYKGILKSYFQPNHNIQVTKSNRINIIHKLLRFKIKFTLL